MTGERGDGHVRADIDAASRRRSQGAAHRADPQPRSANRSVRRVSPAKADIRAAHHREHTTRDE